MDAGFTSSIQVVIWYCRSQEKDVRCGQTTIKSAYIFQHNNNHKMLIFTFRSGSRLCEINNKRNEVEFFRA